MRQVSVYKSLFMDFREYIQSSRKGYFVLEE